MKKVILVCLIILGMATTLFAFDDEDFQVWNTVKANWKIADDWKLSLEEEFYQGDNASGMYYQHSDLGLTYSGFAKWFDVSVNYRQIFQKSNGDWSPENRPHVNATFKWDLYGFSFSDRSRYEYRFISNKENAWKYRNCFKMSAPWKLTKFEIRPYTAYEIFYDSSTSSLNRKRLYGGFTFKITESVSADLYYMRQSDDKKDYWNHANVLGTRLNINF
ncbi:MAG: DUF2490 domain-containing protein [Candidatus Omnitrophica bacterium]|nr:DUF2490 domain-containing protein [Candidatus Omnitrophota bacterium]